MSAFGVVVSISILALFAWNLFLQWGLSSVAKNAAAQSKFLIRLLAIVKEMSAKERKDLESRLEGLS